MAIEDIMNLQHLLREKGPLTVVECARQLKVTRSSIYTWLNHHEYKDCITLTHGFVKLGLVPAINLLSGPVSDVQPVVNEAGSFVSVEDALAEKVKRILEEVLDERGLTKTTMRSTPAGAHNSGVNGVKGDRDKDGRLLERPLNNKYSKKNEPDEKTGLYAFQQVRGTVHLDAEDLAWHNWWHSNASEAEPLPKCPCKDCNTIATLLN